VNLPRSTAFGDADGWVQFKHLENGDWIITRWAIRYPETEEQVGRSATTRFVVTGSRVTGGLAMSVSKDGAVLHRDEGAALRVELRASDSVNGWQRAVATIAGTRLVTVADSMPTILFTGMAAGRFRLQVTTPFMLSIDAPAVRTEVEVSFDSVRTVSVTLPGIEEVANRKCGSFGSLAYGTVTHPDGRAVTSARMDFQWTEQVRVLARGRTQIPRSEERSIIRQTDGSGRWAACLPPGRLIRAHISKDEDVWSPQVLQVRSHRADIVIPVRTP